jgi:membrane fusion protein (multidrug efflux system)
MSTARDEARELRPVSTAPAPASTPAVEPKPPAPNPRRRFILIAALLAVVAAGVGYYLYAQGYEDTDDAQIDGNISNVSPRIAGTIKTVYVSENQTVKAGDTLADIDPSDLAIAVTAARANVAQADALLQAEDPTVSMTETSNQASITSASSDLLSAQSGLSAARKDIEQLTAQLAQAAANNRTAQLEKERSEHLIKEGAISSADFDTHMNAASAAQSNVDAIEQALAAAKDRASQQQARLSALQGHISEVRDNAPRQVQTRKASVLMRQAQLDLAKSQLAQAELNLTYAKIIAPVSGIIGKKSISVGDHVSPGQQIMAIAETSTLWVTANFRETQLERMHPGQSAKLHVDAIDTDLHGVVESIAGATGSRFSVLPPENASGNYVKVVQRIPVRIKLDPGQAGLDRLRPGMSVEPTVKLQ